MDRFVEAPPDGAGCPANPDGAHERSEEPSFVAPIAKNLGRVLSSPTPKAGAVDVAKFGASGKYGGD